MVLALKKEWYLLHWFFIGFWILKMGVICLSCPSFLYIKMATRDNH